MTTSELQRQIHRNDLCREATFTLRAADTSDDEPGDGFTIDGYAAVYDTPTEIDSWEGTFSEEIQFGAFRKSLRERTPKMQFDHGHHPLLGSLPIGRWESVTEEQGRGLRTIGRLHDNWLVEPFRQAIAEKSVDGMSFRFSVVREEWLDKDGKKITDPNDLMELLWSGGGDRGPIRRILKELKITEAGPVTWPAYAETSVGMRSKPVTIDLGRLDDPRERGKLARAVYAADDAAARTMSIKNDEDEPPATSDPVVEHPAPEQAAPPDTEATPVGHPSNNASESRANRMRIGAARIALYTERVIDGKVRSIEHGREGKHPAGTPG